MKVLQDVSSLCESTSSKLSSKDEALIQSLMWLVEAKVKIVLLIESATQPHGSTLPVLKDSPDTPLELAVASIRNVVGVIQYALDPTRRRGRFSTEHGLYLHEWSIMICAQIDSIC